MVHSVASCFLSVVSVDFEASLLLSSLFVFVFIHLFCGEVSLTSWRPGSLCRPGCLSFAERAALWVRWAGFSRAVSLLALEHGRVRTRDRQSWHVDSGAQAQ